MRRRHIRWFTLSLVLLSLISPFALAEKLFDFKDTTLDNGMRVLTLEDFSTPIVAVQVWYHVGSKNEHPERQGFAHMFEHMMFRGTDLLGPEEHFALIRETGGSCNAFTSFDYTAYVNTLPSNQLELALWLEAERLMFLKVDKEGFDTERKVVEEERRMGLNEPYGSVFEQVSPVLFKTHPYRWMPIGNIPNLRAASTSDLQSFWDRYYVPDNATLVIVGAVKHADAQEMAKKYFGWMPKSDGKDAPKFVEQPQTAPREVTIEEPFGPVPLVGYAYRGVPTEHEDSIPIELLMMILGGGESSRLYQDLVKNKKVCTQVMADTFLLEDDGVFGAGAALMPEGDLEGTLKAIEGHLQAVIDAPVSERELTKVKNQLRRASVTDTLTVYSRADELGRVTTVYDDPEWVNKKLAKIESTTAEDVQRVAKQYIAAEGRTLIRILPTPGKELPQDGADTVAEKPETPEERKGPKVGATRPDWFPKQPPMASLLDELPMAEAETQTLENGLKVVVLSNSEVPFVTVMLGVKSGAWAEDPGNPGAASMALDMLTKGTKNYTAAELAEAIEYNALTLGGSAAMDAAEVTATGLSEKTPLAMELLAEVVLRPTFPAEEFKVAQEQRLLSLKISEEDPNYVVERELRRELYGEHPYSRTVSGEMADVEKLSTDVLAQFWNKQARPGNSVLYIAGDIKAKRAFSLAKEYFAGWKPEGALEKKTLPAFPAPQGTRIIIVDRPGAVQSEIRIAQLSITRDHPDYHISRVFTQIFGGAFNSRLNKTIRIERGLTYGAGGGITPALFTGLFRSSTFTKTPSTAETVQAILDVINSMKEQPASPEELHAAKSYLVGNFPSQLETPQDVLEYAWLIEYAGLPADYLNKALQGYKDTTAADLQRITNTLVDPSNLTIIVAGEAKAIKGSLEKIAPVTVISEASAPGAALGAPPIPPAPAS